ncbi:MAG: ESX-1 secretion-associated protein [Mycobacteriaceae bacterium]|nr:ESX-1 secretion-associated protein [Mycobacteriaceae bacterium]
MADLVVVPGVLELLAQRLDEAGQQAERAAVVTTHIEREVWRTYGPFFGIINDGFVQIEQARRAAVRHLSASCVNQAANLRAATQAYVSGDALCSDQLRATPVGWRQQPGVGRPMCEVAKQPRRSTAG